MSIKFLTIFILCLSVNANPPTDVKDATQQQNEKSSNTLATENLPYEIPQVWTNVELLAATCHIRYKSLKVCIAERRKYLEEVSHQNLKIDEKLLEEAREELQVMENSVETMKTPLWGWGKKYQPDGSQQENYQKTT